MLKTLPNCFPSTFYCPAEKQNGKQTILHFTFIFSFRKYRKISPNHNISFKEKLWFLTSLLKRVEGKELSQSLHLVMHLWSNSTIISSRCSLDFSESWSKPWLGTWLIKVSLYLDFALQHFHLTSLQQQCHSIKMILKVRVWSAMQTELSKECFGTVESD